MKAGGKPTSRSIKPINGFDKYFDQVGNDQCMDAELITLRAITLKTQIQKKTLFKTLPQSHLKSVRTV